MKELSPGRQTNTAFHSPKRETEPVCVAEQCDDDSMNGETDEPVNDSVTYQAMNGPSDDDSYEEIIGALYDVPRLTSPPVTPSITVPPRHRNAASSP